MTVAENIAFLVRDHVRFQSPEYLDRKAAGDLAAVQAKFDTPVLIMGDFNDEPSDASVIGHLQASSELDRVVGPTNQITKFETEVATYRGDDTWRSRLGGGRCWLVTQPATSGGTRGLWSNAGQEDWWMTSSIAATTVSGALLRICRWL